MTIVPFAFSDSSGRTIETFKTLDVTVTARVVQVCEERRWFRVEYDLGGRNGLGHECFKF